MTETKTVGWFGIPGTGNWTLGSPGGWYKPGSTFSERLAARGLVNVNVDGRPNWSTGIAGVPSIMAKYPFITFAAKSAWEYGGLPTGRFLQRLDEDDRRAIVHSHGLYPFMHAVAADAIKCPVLISVGSPYRDDMLDIVKLARKHIGYWVHVTGGHSDWVAVGGGVFDGALGINRKHDLADKNLVIKGMGHSGILKDIDGVDVMDTNGLILDLKAA